MSDSPKASPSSAPASAIDFAVLSDVGMRRANNQDAATAWQPDSQERYHRKGHLFVVADGMGAHAAGEMASRMAIEKIRHQYLKLVGVGAAEALRQAVEEANREIHRRGQENPEFHNMGTTASALALLPDGAIVAHVGDSRVYRLRGAVFEQLTFDHSLFWEMHAAGQIHPDSALSQSIPRNVITRSLGPSPEVQIDLEGPWPIQKGDRYLLCSDGLTGQVTDEEIGVILTCLPPHQAVRVLVDLANLRGGPDNITVIAVHIAADPLGRSTESSFSPPRKARRPPELLLALCAGGLLGTLLLALAQQWGGSIAIGILTLLAMIVTLFIWLQPPSRSAAGAEGQNSRNSSPYRRYPVRPDDGLIHRLAGTVMALREAAREKGWKLNWSKIDHLQGLAERAHENRQGLEAVRLQCQAIIETMEQLREQRNRQAGDSTLDIQS